MHQREALDLLDARELRVGRFDGALHLGSQLWLAERGRRLPVDDELRQDGSTAEMVTGIAEMIAALSRICTLEPGDLIATGTPGGVGLFTGGLLRPGQRVRIEIEGIGTIDNPVVAEPVHEES